MITAWAIFVDILALGGGVAGFAGVVGLVLIGLIWLSRRINP